MNVNHKGIEVCSACQSATGHAGYGEDSIGYVDGMIGPLCDSCNARLRVEVEADGDLRVEVEQMRLWLLGIAETFGELSNIDPLDSRQENLWHGIVRIVAMDGTSEMYFTETEEDVADWNDSPLGAVEWVVKPKGLSP